MASPWTSASAPPMIMIFGPPGVGKTTDILKAVGVRAIIAAAEGALKPVDRELGFKGFIEVQARTIRNATEQLRAARKVIAGMPKDKRPLWYVTDEFTYMSDRSMAEHERKLTGYKVWGALREDALEFRDEARECGLGVIVNAWDMSFQSKENGKKIRGGPRLAGDMPDYFPGITDANFRAQFNESIRPWGAEYVTVGSNTDGMKTRIEAPNPAPMNLGVILREAGELFSPYPIPWLEDAVPKITEFLLTLPPEALMQGCEEAYSYLMQQDKDPRHVRWAISDARDTVRLRRAKAKKWATFAGGDTSSPSNLPALNTQS